MIVLVDTSVWSLALRRRPGDLSPGQRRIVAELEELIREGRVALPGLVRQELLSGIGDRATYERLRDRLRSFPDLTLTTEDHETAAVGFNRCRSVGLAGSAIDFLMCAAAELRSLAVFTTDDDFVRYASHLEFRLHHPR